MTEKRSFKNVTVSDERMGSSVFQRHAQGPTPILDHFPYAEWDMEVTFTPKPRDIRVGDVVTHSTRLTVGTVLALYSDHSEEANKSWAWVLWKAGLPPQSSSLRNLSLADI